LIKGYYSGRHRGTETQRHRGAEGQRGKGTKKEVKQQIGKNPCLRGISMVLKTKKAGIKRWYKRGFSPSRLYHPVFDYEGF